MSLWKRGRQYWTDFTVAGRRYRKRLGTTNLRTATRRQRELVEVAGHGRLSADEQGPKGLSDAIGAYLDAKRMRCSPRTIELEEERLSLVKKHFGDVPLSAITASAIAEFQRTRHEAGIANRTINMDVGVLSRAQVLRPMASAGRPRSQSHGTTASSRPRLDSRRTQAAVPISRVKPRVGARVLRRDRRRQHVDAAGRGQVPSPMRRRSRQAPPARPAQQERDELPGHPAQRVGHIEAAARMFERADLLGHTEPEHYLWPACQWGRYDPTKLMLKWDTAWRALRDEAGLHGLRFHDLRHTVITELAEMGVADHVLESISGHLSRRMLEHYSHIRIDAKRQALDALDAARRDAAGNGNGDQKRKNDEQIPAIVEVSETSRHSHVTVCG
jgi:integrase